MDYSLEDRGITIWKDWEINLQVLLSAEKGLVVSILLISAFMDKQSTVTHY